MHLDERVEGAVDGLGHADQESQRDGGQRRQAKARQHARHRIGQLHADALVVGAAVVERVFQVLPQLRADVGWAGEGRLRAAGRGIADQRGVGRVHRRAPRVGACGNVPQQQKSQEQGDGQEGRPPVLHGPHQVLRILKPAR
ncbi:hypothetical protein G6F24_017136 [Rhizopus arrhizus]|nr:hypothetical protein G6F24_017136 [Rhizopus arrhizus]